MEFNKQKQDFYKRAYLYALKIIQFTEKTQKDSASIILGKQLIRSGTSVTANLIEAKSASSKKDYINFYQHSLKSANESKLWIGLLRDSKKADAKESEELLKETIEIANILASSVLTMKGKK
jgi:four helix bundle protein